MGVVYALSSSCVTSSSIGTSFRGTVLLDGYNALAAMGSSFVDDFAIAFFSLACTPLFLASSLLGFLRGSGFETELP